MHAWQHPGRAGPIWVCVSSHSAGRWTPGSAGKSRHMRAWQHPGTAKSCLGLRSTALLWIPPGQKRIAIATHLATIWVCAAPRAAGSPQGNNNMATVARLATRGRARYRLGQRRTPLDPPGGQQSGDTCTRGSTWRRQGRRGRTTGNDEGSRICRRRKREEERQQLLYSYRKPITGRQGKHAKRKKT